MALSVRHFVFDVFESIKENSKISYHFSYWQISSWVWGLVANWFYDIIYFFSNSHFIQLSTLIIKSIHFSTFHLLIICLFRSLWLIKRTKKFLNVKRNRFEVSKISTMKKRIIFGFQQNPNNFFKGFKILSYFTNQYFLLLKILF